MDDTTKFLNNLLSNWAESIGMDSIEVDEDGFISLSFDERITLNIQADAETESVVLSAELGTVDSDNQADIMHTMLTANFGWMETGGIGTLSLIPAEANDPITACVMYRQKVRTLDATSFQSLCDEFVDVAEAWTVYLQEFGQQESTKGEGLNPLDPSMQRV